jgi:hypothetical protein
VLTIGIDPGLTGAVAVLEPNGQLRTFFDLPVIRDHALAWIDGDRLLSALLEAKGSDTARVIIERASARPGPCARRSASGSPSARSSRPSRRFACRSNWSHPRSGSVPSACRLTSAPRSTGRGYCSPSADLSHACHHGRAEALLIAYWGLRHDTAQRTAA